MLWRDLLRATHAVGGAEAAVDVAADLELTLHAAGIHAPEPATSALIAELLPGTERPDAGRG